MKYKTDKVGLGYIPMYKWIARVLGPRARVCEVGVLHGGSLAMWQSMFPDGTVVGVDKNEWDTWPAGSWKIVAEQDDPQLPKQLRQIALSFDLIVDDASHIGALTQATFDLLWPLVAPGGFYVVEDWHVALPDFDQSPFPTPFDGSMLTMVAGLLRMLTREGEVEDITYRHGMAVVRKRVGGGV